MEKNSKEKKRNNATRDTLGGIIFISVVLFFLIQNNIISVNVDFSEDRSLPPEAKALKKIFDDAYKHPIEVTSISCSAADNPTNDSMLVIDNEIIAVAIGEITYNSDNSISFKDSMMGHSRKTLRNCTVLTDN